MTTAASSRTAALLGGRAPKARAKRGDTTTAPRSEIGPNPQVRDYEQGAFPHQAVAPFPPGLVELLERRTAKPFPAELLAEYERIRAFLGYQGIDMSAKLRAGQRLDDGIDRGPPVTPALPARARHLAARTPIATPTIPGSLAMPDPDDLGD